MDLSLPVTVLLVALAAAGEPSVSASPVPPDAASATLRNHAKAQGVLETQPASLPDGDRLFSFHYGYAKTLEHSKKYYDVIGHLRLAYLCAGRSEDREAALFKRAEAYRRLENFTEAAMCLKVFLRKFPDSRYQERARSLLGESLYKLARFELAGQCEGARKRDPECGVHCLRRTYHFIRPDA